MNLIQRHSKPANNEMKRIVVDRCNISKNDRRVLMDLMSSHLQKILLVCTLKFLHKNAAQRMATERIIPP